VEKLETGTPHDAEQRLRRADGVYRWFQVRALPLRDSGGRIIRWYALFTDIDDRKKMEEQLRRNEKILLEAQRLGHTGSWSLDLASGTVTSSPEALKVFGVSPGEDYSSPDFWFNRIHPDDGDRVRALFEKSVMERTKYKADHRIVLPDGTIKHQQSVGSPVVDARGEMIEFLGAIIDTTEHVRAREELEEANGKSQHDVASRIVELMDNRVLAAVAMRALHDAQSARLYFERSDRIKEEARARRDRLGEARNVTPIEFITKSRTEESNG